ncbi:MAG: hypothetical protein AAGC67_08290 [Myxococcota bacterium]
METIDRNKLAFDTILVRKSGDNYNAMPLDAFLDLPVDERISLIMGKKVRFFMEEIEVPVYAAISSLDAATA